MTHSFKLVGMDFIRSGNSQFPILTGRSPICDVTSNVGDAYRFRSTRSNSRTPYREIGDRLPSVRHRSPI